MLIDFAEISSFSVTKDSRDSCAWERYVLGATWMPTEAACCKFWVHPTNAICPHWTAIAPYQTLVPLCTHFLNFKMQA
jgi:hypothetical protein